MYSRTNELVPAWVPETMWGHPVSVPTDIGETLRQEYEVKAEEDKQRAIRCTEEVVRREEAQLREQALAAAREEWKHERQQLFKDAHQSQLRAIAKQTAILEDKLRKEFSERLMKVDEANRQYLEKIVKETWEEAEEVKRKAILETRLEEQSLAREEAGRVAERVMEERGHDKEVAALEKAQALEDQKLRMEEMLEEALKEQQRDLELIFEGKLTEEHTQYKLKLSEVKQQYEEQIGVSEGFARDLADMTAAQNEWEKKHAALKLEFSDFIDQFPGFRGDFVLK